MVRLEMKSHWYEKLQYHINREAAKTSVLSSGQKMINMNVIQVKKYTFWSKKSDRTN